VNAEQGKVNLRMQRGLLAAALLLFAFKLLAWHLTGATSVLSDALESIVNIIAGAISLYAVYLSAQPADKNHPYGHGKVEFLSSAIEGTLILIAALLIVWEAIHNLIYGHELKDLGIGTWIILLAALINYVLGSIAIRQGKNSHSPAMVANGKHLQSDTWTSLGIVGGLFIIRFTGEAWIDSVIALVLASVLAYTAYGIIRRSVTGIMDEADLGWLEDLVKMLNENRRFAWVDLHNLRVIRYGPVYHIDCHLTVPWYYNVHEAHAEVEELNRIIREHYGAQVEMFVHTDACLPESCAICTMAECTRRKQPITRQISWTVENVSGNRKHSADNC
jgi:cation diffusion facilitator family transporter